MAYRHLAGLGGFRQSRAESPNAGWRNISFRGYADYTQTDQFAEALAQLTDWASEAPTAMMCSEALWWRCHRRLVADWLLVSGVEVVHIASDARGSVHELTPFAVLEDGVLVYPARADVGAAQG